MTGQKAAAKFPLLQPSLEGLMRYGHAISIEYFGDLLNVIQALLTSPLLPLPQRLQLLLTASSLLKYAPESCAPPVTSCIVYRSAARGKG